MTLLDVLLIAALSWPLTNYNKIEVRSVATKSAAFMSERLSASATLLNRPCFLFPLQERLIQLQNSARDSYESQISSLEQRSKKAFDQCTQLADLVENTEARCK